MNARLWQLTCCLIMAVITLSGCGDKQKNTYAYIPVQMSDGDAWSIIDKDGKEVVKEEFPADARFSPVSDDGAFWVKQNGTYQLFSVSSPKMPLIDEEFTKATQFVAGHAAVSAPNIPIRIINTKGHIVATLPKTIKRCDCFCGNGYAVVKDVNNKEGIVNTKGQIIVEPKYEGIWISKDEETFIAQKKDGRKMEILDFSGNRLGEINEEKYDLLSCIEEGKVLVREAGLSEPSPIIVLDNKGKKLFEVKKSSEQWWSSEALREGYLVFKTEDSKYGVVDKDGNSVIRPKYNGIFNLGNGEFAAQKSDRWGVVDANDETVLDFDYDWIWGSKIGDNYLVKDGGSWALVNREGREVASFDNYNLNAGEYSVEYVDIEGLTNAMVQMINDFEGTKTAKAMATTYELPIDNNHYTSSINQNIDYDGKVGGTIFLIFESNIAEEKTHTEEVNDGWFTTTQTISDGWQWTDALPTTIGGALYIHDNAINAADLYQSICQKLANGRTKISDGTYSKKVKIGGQTMECRTSLTQGARFLELNMIFLKQ